MAGDWIKMEKATARKPEILRIAQALSIHPDHALGLCFRFWCWCDDQLEKCHAPSVTQTDIDLIVDRAGFASALVEVGWLQARNGSLVIPNFDRHLSQSAKGRALSSRRKSLERVTKMSRSERDKNATREEKRREEKKDRTDVSCPSSSSTSSESLAREPEKSDEGADTAGTPPPEPPSPPGSELRRALAVATAGKRLAEIGVSKRNLPAAARMLAQVPNCAGWLRAVENRAAKQGIVPAALAGYVFNALSAEAADRAPPSGAARNHDDDDTTHTTDGDTP